MITLPTSLTTHRLHRLLPLALLLLAAPLLHANNEAAYEAQMRELQRNIQQLQRDLQRVQSSRDQLEQELQKSETEIGDLLKQIERIETQLQQQGRRLDELQRERTQLQAARRSQQHQVAEQVRAAHQLGQQSQLKLLLNQESPERISRLLKYHDYFLAARAEKLNAYLATLAQLDALEPRIQGQSAELENSRAQLARRHQQLAARQSERQATLARLQRSIADTGQELSQRQRDRERLQALLDEMTAAITNLPLPGDGARFSSRRGQLPWPAQGRVAARFGSVRANHQLPLNGVLISANAGQPVVAVHHGRVVFSDYFRGHGLLVILDHGEGYLSLYAHNQALLKETGEWVSAGDIIARVGNTGGQAQPGLYFEIRHSGKPTDPSPWLARA